MPIFKTSVLSIVVSHTDYVNFSSILIMSSFWKMPLNTLNLKGSIRMLFQRNDRSSPGWGHPRRQLAQ